jgi:hypothetical protein
MAWQSSRGICWFGGYSDRLGFGVAECVSPTTAPIEWIAATPGRGSVVEGLAVDAVKGVSVELCDGSILRTRPRNNFYFAVLPPRQHPWDVCRITAHLNTGGTFETPISTKPPTRG